MTKIIKKLNPIVFLLCLLFFTSSVFAQDSTKVRKKTSKSVGTTLYGQASFYSNSFDGKQTANGEIYRQKGMTCACNSLPLGTWIEVTNLRNNKKVILKTNDRLHPRMKRLVDVTLAAAQKLDFVNAGLTRVKVVVLDRKKHK
jgi:rare lipoprotein A